MRDIYGWNRVRAVLDLLHQMRDSLGSPRSARNSLRISHSGGYRHFDGAKLNRNRIYSTPVKH